MRTKSLVLAAAALTAGLLSASAQVYSLNIVGYVNLTLKPGLNLISCPLQGTDPTNLVAHMLTNQAPLLNVDSLIYTWNPTAQTFNQAALSGEDGNWYNGDYSASAPDKCAPGAGFFLKNGNATDVVLTIVGEVKSGTNNLSVVNNLNILADAIPTAADIITNGFPVVDTSLLYTWNVTGQTYNQARNGISAASQGDTYGRWYNGDYSAELPYSPKVGEGFVYDATTSGAGTWTRIFLP